MGNRSLGAVLVLAAFCLFLRTGLLLRLVQEAARVLRRDYPLEFHPAVDGMPGWTSNHSDAANAVLRLECRKLWQRLCCGRVLPIAHLREHDAEGKANAHQGPLRHLVWRDG